MWTNPGASPPTPEHFDEHYRNAEGAHITLRPEVQEQLNEVLEIVGPVEGKRILDLGGGAMLGRACEKASIYVLVDMSSDGCRIAKKVAPWTVTYTRDVIEFLWVICPDFIQFDVTVAIGLVEYLPGNGMDLLFRLCPSPVLAFTTSILEAYLKYPARITVPSREDVAAVAEKYRWRVTKELPRPDHVWARFERY